MSQLQIGLITLGALIILAVLLFNWWQERNIKREMIRRFDGPLDDVLMDESRAQPAIEPVEDFHIDTDAVLGLHREAAPVPQPVEVAQQVESMAEELAVEAAPEALPAEEEVAIEEAAPVDYPEPTAAAAPLGELPSGVDPLIDEIAVVTLNQACTGAAIRDALQPLPAFQAQVRWLGEGADGNVVPLTKAQETASFVRVVAALQLADRSGPANGEDLRNFHAKVEDLSARVGGALEWREHGDPLQHARELDQFCIDVDVMIGLQLLAGSGSPFAGTKLRGIVEAAGGELKDDGQFHFAGDNGASLFVLTSPDRKPITADALRTAMLRGVVLLMDVPRVTDGAEAFNRMVLVGRKLEAALAVKLMDENQRPLGDAEIDHIRQKLKAIYAGMFARGIAPGSALALRLFS